MAWIITDGYPQQDTLSEVVSLLSEPLPSGIWQSNNNYPYINNKTNETISVFSEPLPSGIFQIKGNINDGYPLYKHNVETVNVLSEPLPEGIFQQVVGEYPTYKHINLVTIGAFKGCERLRKVELTKYTLEFGDYSFYECSELDKIRINILSEYNENTTFTQDCIVEYFPIQYYLNTSLKDIGKADCVSFSTVSELDDTVDMYTGGLPKHRVRKPINEIQEVN